MTPEQYEEVLTSIAGKAHKLTAYCMHGSARSIEQAQALAMEICTLAGNTRQQSQMQQEQQHVDTLDLASMPAPSFADSPE